MGVAVLASVFAANGGYESPAAFTDGITAAIPVAVVMLILGALLALAVPGKRSGATKPENAEPRMEAAPAGASA